MQSALNVALVDLGLADSKAMIECLGLRISAPLPNYLFHRIGRRPNVDVNGPLVGTDFIASHDLDANPFVSVALDISNARFGLNSRHDGPHVYLGEILA